MSSQRRRRTVNNKILLRATKNKKVVESHDYPRYIKEEEMKKR